MEARSVSEDDSSENSQSSGQKPLKPKRRSMVERELETNMTARVTSPLSFIEPGLNTSRYGRARKVKADKEFCDTNKSVSDYLKSPDSELSPKVIKSQANTSSTNNASLKQGTTPITKAENLIEKIHNENLSLSRFGSITKSTPLKHNKTYIRKDLIQRKDTDNPCKMLKTMFSPSKSPYKSSKSSHLSVFLERYSADKSGIEMNETVSTEGLTPGGKDCPSKKSRKRTRKSDTAITETKTNADLDSSRTSSSTKKSKRHSLNAINSVVKTLDFNTKNKKALLRRQEKEVPKRTKPEKELQKSDQPKIEHNSQKQARNSSKKKNPKPTPITQTAEMPDEIEQPENNHPKSEQINMEQPSKKQTGSSSKRKNKKTTSLSLIEMPEPQGLLIEKTSVVKTLDFDIKKKPNKLKLTKTEANKEVEPDATKPESQAPLEIAISQDYFATNGLFEIESQCSYNVGDLAWSRVGTYPFWPCIVTREPFTELFVKKKLFGRVERDVIHVTFFADNGRRGWIVDNMLRQYHGIEEFLAARDGFTIEDKKKDPKLYAAYFISDKKRDTWNQAVNEAENLFKEPKHTRTDILYEMLSHNKNVKILKKPKTVKIETPNIDLKKPRPVKLDTTDSDVSLSESLYDSLFSDDDSKTVDPVKSKNRSRNKSFDVSDVVTACLDNMAVKTGMAKIQMQSHMDRWLQKAKSQTPEKKQIVLTPNKDRKLSLTLRKNKKTPVKTDTVKPYPLCKFAKESPDNGILNSLPTENDYTKYDVKNENPVYCDNVNTENTLVSADEVHYIESGTGIGTILAVESLSDKVSDNQETINDTDMDISSVIEDVSKDDKELFSNNTLDIATIETSYVNGAAMEIEHINSKNEECGLNITNLPPTDTEIPSNKDASVVSSNEIEQYPMKSTANGDDEPMDVEHDKPKNLVYDLETNMCNMQDNIHLSSEVNIKECKDITINNSENTVLSNVVDHDITDEKKLVVDQPDNILETTETNCDVIPKCVSHDFENNDAENCLGETVPEMQTHEPNVKQDINSGNDTDALANCKEKNTNANEEINFSNNHIQNREVINNQPKNDDLSNEAIVENITGSKCEETIDNRKSNTGTRKSLRRKSESPITAETDHQVNENSNINTIHEKTNKIVSELVDNTENKVKSIINNEVKQEKKDTKRKSGRLSSFDKLNQIPRVSVTKLNVYHMEICENKLNYPTKKVNDDIKIKNIEISGKDAAETKQKSNNPSKYVTDNDIQINNIDKSSILSTEPPKENHVCGIENIKTSETELIEKTLESKQILENGIYENNDQSTISNQYAKLNGTSELHINVISNLNDCKTIPEEKVTEDLLKKLKNNVRKSKRIEIKRSTNKSNDLQKEVEDAKIFLLQNIESPQNHPISPGLDDIKADASTNSNMTDERETRARDFDKEINLITSVIELTPDAKDVYRNVSNVIQADEGVTNNANENKQCSKKIFNNVCDQSIELDTSFEEIKSNRIESKSSLFGYSNRDNLSEPSNIDINLENAKCEYPHNIVGVSLNGKENIGLTSLTINELQHDNNISNLVNENTDDNSIKMSDYDNLVITPEKIINADVIIDNGNNDELDSSEDVKLNGISVISSIDTQLPRKRGRPRKSNPLVIDNVVIEEISLTDNQIDTIHSNNDVKVTVIDDLKPRKRGRPKKYQLAEQDKVLTNGYHQDPESLPEFAHLMDLDVSLDGADFNQTVKVENIALLTEVDLLAKVTEANLSSEPMDVDYCQVIPLSIKKEVYNEQQGITKGINENAYDLAQNVVDFNTNLEIIESPPTDTLITDKDNNTILINDETNNKQTEMDEKIEDIRTQNQNIESISLSSISIKSELESISSSNVQSETEEKQVTNKQTLNVEMMEATEKAKNKAGKIKQDSDEPSEEREIQDGISKRKQRVKPENKLTNEVYKALDDPEFAKYLEMRQDALIDENPHVSQDDIVKYLYKTWIYEQSLKPDAVKSDDLIESNLVKGLGNMSTSQPKKIKKRVKSQIDKEEKYDLNEVIIPRDRSKRRTNPLYINADDTDIEDELEMFEIFKNKNKAKRVTPTTLNSQTIDEKVIPTDGKTESEQDDIPLANLIADKDTQIIPEDLTEVQAEEVIEKPFDQVEYYFAQLTQPKPNVFKGLIRERVCDICFKTSNLVKCKGPCNGMFHIECVKEETTQVSVQNIWSRGRKKKKPRGPRPKNRSQDDSQSDDKDIIIEDIFESSVSVPIDADTFETQLADKMKEILEKDQVEDLASSDEELKWDDADPGKCEIVNITLKARRNPSHNSDIDFKCNDCLKLLIPKCYVCKSEKSPKNSVEIRQRCQIAQCHKYYHLDCLDMWPQTQFNQGESARKTSDLFDILSCPRHVCHSCVCDNPRGCNTRFSGEKLARCVKCPATYHSFTKCLPAGSQILSASHIICPRHTVNRPGKVPCHVNTGWCFICALGGSLICCEYCPTSFHADCLNIAPPEGNYMCEDCETGRLPLYGEMVWVKLGHYRWWPGLVLHPCEIPDNIICMRHSPGEFVVRFFGQYDHYWVNRGRVFPFQEGDSGRISSQRSKIDEAFTLAIEHAQRAFQILKTVPPNSEEEAEIAQSFLPPQYVRLRVNKPCGAVTIPCARAADEQNGLSQCDCDPRLERPCDANSQCLNRMLLTECGPSCRAEDRCQNRAFEKRLYPKMAPYRTPHRGWGLRTLEDVKAGQFVIEYVGELIDEVEFKRRMQLKHEIRDENYYFLTLDKERMIDAGPKGNLARFMNHSCEPNCETQKWTVLGDVRVGLFAIHDIPAFTELTFNYNLECAGIDKKRCMCGAPRCSGYIGAKPKTLEEINPKKKDVYKKRIYRKRKKEDSPSTTKIKIPKPRTTTRSKPKELTEIEKDLLIIKNATNGLLSSDSECSLKLILDEKTNKRKRSFSSEDLLNSDGVEPSRKILKLDMSLDSESPSSEGIS